MKCHDREQLFLFCHQMLAPQQAERVRRHLADCAACARVVEEYRSLDAVLDDWTVPEPSPWFDASARAHVAQSTRKSRRFFGFGRLQVLVAGLAAMVLIVGGLVVFNHQSVVENHQPAASQHQPETAANAQQTPPATTEAVRQPLPPGEQLKMDENLSVLEDYDVVSNFGALSELPQANEN